MSRHKGPQTSNKLLMQPKAEQSEHIDSIEFLTTLNEEHLAQFAISRKKKLLLIFTLLKNCLEQPSIATPNHNNYNFFK